MKPRLINSIESLDKALDEDIHDYIVQLNGKMYSRKSIFHGEQEGLYEIYNYIDGSEQVLTREQLFDKELTLIGNAMQNNAFYADLD